MAKRSMSFINNRFRLWIMKNVGDSYSAEFTTNFFDYLLQLVIKDCEKD